MAEPRREKYDETLATGARFLVVEARFYEDIGAMLFAGCEAALSQVHAQHDVIRVPGALEIPAAIAIACDAAARTGQPYAGAIALGCVIRGETYHFEIVAGESSRALMDMSVARKLALGNGILTVETEEQAIARADPRQGDKGGDAARAALALYRVAQTVGG